MVAMSGDKNKEMETKSKEKETEFIDDDELDLPIAPDGGWGWVILAASFFLNFIVDGIGYTFAIIYDDLGATFDTSKSQTAVVGSLLTGIYCIVGRCRRVLLSRFVPHRAPQLKLGPIRGQITF